jgi:hypothetical protein
MRERDWDDQDTCEHVAYCSHWAITHHARHIPRRLAILAEPFISHVCMDFWPPMNHPHSSLELSKFKTVHILWCSGGHQTNQHWWQSVHHRYARFSVILRFLMLLSTCKFFWDYSAPTVCRSVIYLESMWVKCHSPHRSSRFGSTLDRWSTDSWIHQMLHRRLSILFFMELRQLCQREPALIFDDPQSVGIISPRIEHPAVVSPSPSKSARWTILFFPANPNLDFRVSLPPRQRVRFRGALLRENNEGGAVWHLVPEVVAQGETWNLYWLRHQFDDTRTPALHAEFEVIPSEHQQFL